MASQGERVLGVVGMCSSYLESMAQDGDPEQDIGVQEQLSRTNKLRARNGRGSGRGV